MTTGSYKTTLYQAWTIDHYREAPLKDQVKYCEYLQSQGASLLTFVQMLYMHAVMDAQVKSIVAEKTKS